MDLLTAPSVFSSLFLLQHECVQQRLLLAQSAVFSSTLDDILKLTYNSGLVCFSRCSGGTPLTFISPAERNRPLSQCLSFLGFGLFCFVFFTPGGKPIFFLPLFSSMMLSLLLGFCFIGRTIQMCSVYRNENNMYLKTFWTRVAYILVFSCHLSCPFMTPVGLTSTLSPFCSQSLFPLHCSLSSISECLSLSSCKLILSPLELSQLHHILNVQHFKCIIQWILEHVQSRTTVTAI